MIAAHALPPAAVVERAEGRVWACPGCGAMLGAVGLSAVTVKVRRSREGVRWLTVAGAAFTITQQCDRCATASQFDVSVVESYAT